MVYAYSLITNGGNMGKKIGLLSFILSLIMALSSCGYSAYFYTLEKDKKFQSETIDKIDQATVKKDESKRPDKYVQAIMTAIEKKDTKIIMSLFSQKVKNDIGENTLEQNIREMENNIKGNIIKFSGENTGGKGHRGGRGMTSKTTSLDIYTDMEIYKVSIVFVTENSTSDDYEINKASIGLDRMTVLPVSNLYDENGIWGKVKWEKYFDKHGVFSEKVDKTAREITYPGQTFTGYSVALFQAKSLDSARPEGCKKFMEQMEAVGFHGDVTEIVGIHLHVEDDLQDEYQAGYRYLLKDSTGKEFLVAYVNEKDFSDRITKIADRDKNVLFNAQ